MTTPKARAEARRALDPDSVSSGYDGLDDRTLVARVTEAKVISKKELDPIDREVVALIDDALAKAKAAPLPNARELTTDVYVSY